ncbi:MAG: transaldolase [Chloroflexi bacterium]|nr:transaldolase [Chloroflexota bacterium]
MNPLVELHAYGQSFWYDNIRRKFLLDGTVQQLIERDGLRGMTSNPSIFEKAIGHSDDYDEQIQALALDGADVTAIYEAVAIADIQTACDLFAFLYEESGGGDGYVSLEVSPHLARDTEGTIADARRLFTAVNRPNLMIKVPATPEGIPAIRQLISEGININVTLMFSMVHYEAVAGAYIAGLAQWMENGGNPQQVASVASFFVSRVDTAVDQQLTALNNPSAQAFEGKVAVANSKVVYQRFQEIFHGEAFAALQAAGGRRQRLLWASTSTKNPAYPDTLYVDELIGSETVNTMPPNTIEAFRDHGRVANTLEANVAEAQAVLTELTALGVDLNDITEQLQVAGVASFSQSFDTLMETIAAKRNALASA